MNDMEQLENQLRSWVPRRPSAKLERRLFAAQIAVALDQQEGTSAVDHQRGFRLHWLAPVTAAFVLLCLLFNQRQGGSAGGGTNSGPMLALISSNQNAYLLPTLPRQQNRADADTFEWTNGSSSTSSVRLLLGLKARN